MISFEPQNEIFVIILNVFMFLDFHKQPEVWHCESRKPLQQRNRAEGRRSNLKSLVSVRLCFFFFFLRFTNDSGYSVSSLGMLIKAKLNLTFMQNVIRKPAAMPSLLIFPFVTLNFYPSPIHNLKFKERCFLFPLHTKCTTELYSNLNVSGHVTKINVIFLLCRFDR